MTATIHTHNPFKITIRRLWDRRSKITSAQIQKTPLAIQQPQISNDIAIQHAKRKARAVITHVVSIF